MVRTANARAPNETRRSRSPCFLALQLWPENPAYQMYIPAPGYHNATIGHSAVHPSPAVHPSGAGWWSLLSEHYNFLEVQVEFLKPFLSALKESRLNATSAAAPLRARSTTPTGGAGDHNGVVGLPSGGVGLGHGNRMLYNDLQVRRSLARSTLRLTL